MRVSRLEPSQVDAGTAEIYDAFLKERGNVPNMFRTVAHRPEYLRTELGKHVVFFRRDESGATLIVRTLHQRMLPDLHLTEAPEE